MGQRTQVLVIKENTNGVKKATFFHHQWGYGRVMYLGFMDLFLQDYAKDAFKNDYDFYDCKFRTSAKFYNENENVPENVLNKANISDLDSIRSVFDYGDNNNGGMVVYIKEDKDKFMPAHFKVGFLLGSEDTEREYDGDIYNKGNDNKAFARWLTPEEYGKMNGGSDYSDPEFVKIFTDFCEYFGVEYIK